MTSRAISILSVSCLSVFALYLLGIAATIFFATWQTGLARVIQETEGSVITLETSYYDAVERFSGADPVAKGFVTPDTVEYVSSTGAAAALSRAGE